MTEKTPGCLYDATTGAVLCSFTNCEGISVEPGQALLEGAMHEPGQIVDIGSDPPVLIDGPPDAVDLAVEKMSAKQAVKDGADNARSFFVTRGDAKAWSLAVKAYRAIDALRRLDDGELLTPATEYPGLCEEVGTRSGNTFREVCETVRDRFLECEAKDGQINRVDQLACEQIDAAESPAEIDQILATVVWPDFNT